MKLTNEQIQQISSLLLKITYEFRDADLPGRDSSSQSGISETFEPDISNFYPTSNGYEVELVYKYFTKDERINALMCNGEVVYTFNFDLKNDIYSYSHVFKVTENGAQTIKLNINEEFNDINDFINMCHKDWLDCKYCSSFSELEKYVTSLN